MGIVPQPIPSLPNNQIGLIRTADRARVASALSGVLPLSGDRWFPRGNGYVPNASARVEKDSNVITPGRAQNFLRYLASSSFTHCADAWGFAGRAIDGILRGDLPGAVHLLYYAELRAAISLLASEGIFIGNVDHFVADSTGLQEFGKQGGKKVGTHRFAWQALQAWTDGPRAQALFGAVVRPGGEAFDDWVASLTSRAAQAKISELFKLMSLDLKEFDHDHQRRNTASYNPGRLHPRDLSVGAIRDLVSEVWSVLEPGPGGAFTALDDALLPDLLRSIFTAVRRPGVAWTDWVEQLAPASQTGTAFLAKLQASTPGTSTGGLMEAMYASKPSETDPRIFFRPMLARTVLLLRLATGSAITLLREGGQTAASVRPWIDSLATARGLWPDAGLLDDPHDLWADIELALDEARAAGIGSLYELLDGLPTGMRVFGQGERVPVWSFA